MPKKQTKFDINDILLEAHKRGQERAIDLSIRSGVPLVVLKNGKIEELKPKYKYVLVPIKADKVKRPRKTAG